ncbi:hypothetical protein ACFVT2_33770 [Streptomyces sp. NPDC058000]
MAEMLCSFEELGGGLWNPNSVDSIFREKSHFAAPEFPKAPWNPQ